MARRRVLGLVLAAVTALGVVLAAPGAAPRARAAAPLAGAPPVLAYYYIWFNASSWNRAKVDFPLLGRYSSDERSVMERHVQWAQDAGLTGFLVSWKSTPVLDRRLRLLIDVAARRHFGLGIVYQGLDFQRRPLPARRVAQDLRLVADDFGRAAPLRFRGKPLVVWSGTWRFGAAQVARATAPVRDRLTILASEKDPAGYARLAASVDGDAYYWSSADPLRTPGYAAKLRRMSAAVHRRGGLWVAPAAPGFDARLVGGSKAVPRRNGLTLRRSLDTALASSPDLVGLISWNEYSENSHVEPSREEGARELGVLADALGARPASTADLDSSQSSPTGAQYGLPLLGSFAIVLLGGAALLARRRRAAHRRRLAARDGYPWAP